MKDTVFSPATLDACALYRCYIPHINLPESRFLYGPTIDWVELQEVKIMVVQRQSTMSNLAALRELKAHGVKLVFDIDDNLWAVPKYNPAYKVFQELKSGFNVCASLCDIATVSTESLKAVVRREAFDFKGEIKVIPNSIDFRLFNEPPLPKSQKRVVVGWGGSGTHKGDVAEAWEALPDILNAERDVWMEFVGYDSPSKVKNHPRVKVRSWVPVAEYPSHFTTWSWDIVLAPLDDNRFNRSKSNIKMLEAATTHAVCLASNVTPYAEFCSHDPELSYLLYNTTGEFKRKLHDLANDPFMRQHYGAKMHKVAKEHYDISKVKKQWTDVFEGL